MLLAPMLYTDVTDAWRLKNPKARFAISAAGIGVELGLAAIALLMWAILPDGPWRSVMFFVSSTAWIASIMVNCTPFLRFDGYHMLSDALSLHSIGPRSMALMQWRLRELLFGLDELPPERFSRRREAALIAFAAATAVYRLFLFLGIALLVYLMFPKALGLPLAVIEIWFFILKPVFREMAVWKSFGMAHLFRSLRARMNASLCGLAVLLCFLPIDRHVSMPAVLQPALQAAVYAAEPAQVAKVGMVHGQQVRKGDILAMLESPEIAFRQEQALHRLALVEEQLARIAADSRERARVQILRNDRQAIIEELQGLTARAGRLVITAPIDGVIDDVMPGLAKGVWVSPRSPLAHIAGQSGIIASALAAETEALRVQEGASATFIAKDGARPAVMLRLVAIGSPGSAGVESSYLSSLSGGPVTMGVDASGASKPLATALPMTFFAAGPAPEQAVIGQLVADAKPGSLARQFVMRLVSVFLRESGF